uniref:Uncharacterized protein n=1 Tax=Craspedostauros australis TaxID=1486917 RepID=A0A6T6EZU0_9STRA
MIFIFFAAMVSITVIVTILLREFYSRREHDVGPCCCCFPFFQRRRRRHLQGLHASDDGETAQVRSDREFAQQVFRQLQTEMREEQKIARRQERRAWYELYLKPFTMVRIVQ